MIVNSTRLNVTRSVVSATTKGTGAAGGIDLLATGNIDLTRASINANAEGAGGTVRIESSRSSLLLHNTTVSAEAGADGNISLAARDLLLVQNSTITARAQGEGGQITLDPQDVVLDRSVINGLSGPNKEECRGAGRPAGDVPSINRQPDPVEQRLLAAADGRCGGINCIVERVRPNERAIGPGVPNTSRGISAAS